MKIAILGAFGTIGRATARALLASGHTVRVVGRSEAKLRSAFAGQVRVEIVPADVATAEGCRRAAAGMDALVYSLGLPYSRRAFSAYPAMMRLAVDAARESTTRRMLHISNVYSYGRPTMATVREDHPREPCSIKGQYRKEQEDVALGVHRAGELETLVLRLPDFYGPHADLSMGNMIIGAAVQNQRANLLGPIDTPHEFVFTPDVGRVVSSLLVSPHGWGESFNLAGAGRITVREFAEESFKAAGHPVRFRVASPVMVRILGVFSSLMREMVEMAYLQTDPVLLDDNKLSRLIGPVEKTPYEAGIRATIEHLREPGATA